MRPGFTIRAASIIVALLLAVFAGFAQRFRLAGHGDGPRPVFPPQGECHFVRVEYTDLPQFHRWFGFASRGASGEGWWLVDWPDADEHFSMGVARLTRVETAEPLHMRLTDDRLFDTPWIYATQTGWWGLTGAEIARLREYLLRGGFLVVDDFWGAEQWEIFRETNFARVARHVRRTQSDGSGRELQHGRGRCVGVCGFTRVSREYDGARLPLWSELSDLRYDALRVEAMTYQTSHRAPRITYLPSCTIDPKNWRKQNEAPLLSANQITVLISKT
jgi:hypothetical protein